jgi:hypothetical protein
MLQYWTERICAAIGDISTIQRAIYCMIGAKYSAHPPVYAMCTVVATYTMLLQFRIFRLQYSTERICAAIGGISTTQWALHLKFGAKYSAHPPVHAMWTIVADIYNVFTAPHIEASIFNVTYLRCYWWYLDHSMSSILQSRCQIQRTSPRLRYVYCGPDISNITTVPHIQDSIFNWTYLRCYCIYADISVRVELQIWCQIQRTTSGSCYVNCVPRHLQCIYSSAYSGFNIQLNVSALLFEISRQFNARYTARLVPNIAHVLQFTLCVLWSRPYTM